MEAPPRAPGLSPRAALLMAWTLAAWWGSTAAQCSSAEYPRATREGTKCCSKCPSAVTPDKPCPGITDADCKCAQGYGCLSPECSSCIVLENCKKGEELVTAGRIHYTYGCQPCPNGTYSDEVNRFCKPWADCQSEGLKTIELGNQTHNVKCGAYGSATVTTLYTPKDLQRPYLIVLAILTAVAVFILILGTIFLHLYIWRMKEKLYIAEDGERSPASNRARPVEDSCSCQYPEEEHGERTAQEDAMDSSLLTLKDAVFQ